jgi:signal transduction histidine kinase
MTLITRFSLVLFAVCAGITAAVVFSHRQIRQKIDHLATDRMEERRAFFTDGAKLQSKGIQGLASSYAWWGEMMDFVEKPDSKWASENIDTLIGTPNGGDALWVVSPDFKLLHSIDAHYRVPTVPFKGQSGIQARAKNNYEFSYFTIIGGELWQIFGSAIQDPTFWRNETPVRGYLLIGVEWNGNWLARLGSLCQSSLSRHIPPLTTSETEPEYAAIPPASFTESLLGLDGKPIATIRGTFDASVIEQVRRSFSEGALVLIIGVVCFLSLLGLFVVFTVMRPLGQIVRSLESRNPTHLSELLVSKSSFGEIARLLSSQFRQGRMLQEEIRRRLTAPSSDDERPSLESNEALRLRLASDLHDGPMQSIYAAGLKIGSMEASLAAGRTFDPNQLASVRTILTECSSNLRNLLLDLEPEELRDQDLDGALGRFEGYLKSVSRRSSEFFVQEGVVDGITRQAQLHIYYITRELISNAARHARPERTSLSFRRQAGFLMISWQNDGFIESASSQIGNGLRNIAQRVDALGGTWKQRVSRSKFWMVDIEIPFTALTESIAISIETE